MMAFVYRSKFRSSEMPQAFQYKVIEKAYKKVCNEINFCTLGLFVAYLTLCFHLLLCGNKSIKIRRIYSFHFNIMGGK